MDKDRVTREQALTMLRESPLLDLMERAHQIRMKIHPKSEVTFVVDTNPNYTNVCVTDCTFCSFFRKVDSSDSYVHSPQEIAIRVAKAHSAGATTVLLQGGHHPSITWTYLERVILEIQRTVPKIHIHPFSAPEISHVASNSNMTVDDVLAALWATGVRTIPGGGAEILVDRVRRRISPKKLSASGWLGCMRKAHKIGFRTTATMTYGHVEADEDIVDHLIALRDLQDETGGFYAFIPWSFKRGTAPLAKLVKSPSTAIFYVRVIALSRIVLDNFSHVQASWFAEGTRAGQLALIAGADDFGGALLEENVLREASHTFAADVDSIVAMIQQAGFQAIQRDTHYRALRAFQLTDPSVADTIRPGFLHERTPFFPINRI